MNGRFGKINHHATRPPSTLSLVARHPPSLLRDQSRRKPGLHRRPWSCCLDRRTTIEQHQGTAESARANTEQQYKSLGHLLDHQPPLAKLLLTFLSYILKDILLEKHTFITRQTHTIVSSPLFSRLLTTNLNNAVHHLRSRSPEHRRLRLRPTP